MLPPLPRRSVWAYCFAQSPSRISLPRKGCRVGLHIVLFEACLAFTLVAACTLARSPYVVTAIRRLQTFRLLHACSGCFRLERLPGGPCTHWKSAALSRRTWSAAVALCVLRLVGSSHKRAEINDGKRLQSHAVRLALLITVGRLGPMDQLEQP